MAYYLAKERREDAAGAYRRYQEYLRANQRRFPPGAFALGTSQWWQDGNDHRSVHDAWLESVTFSELSDGERNEYRTTAIRVRLLGAYHDGFIELFYPRVSSYSLQSPASARGLGDWRYDEFRLSPSGQAIHEIEWAGFPGGAGARWIIEASDIEYEWKPK
jgi:hypothetical protein